MYAGVTHELSILFSFTFTWYAIPIPISHHPF